MEREGGEGVCMCVYGEEGGGDVDWNKTEKLGYGPSSTATQEGNSVVVRQLARRPRYCPCAHHGMATACPARSHLVRLAAAALRARWPAGRQ